MQSDAYFSASAIVANDLDSQRPDVVSQRTWRVICTERDRCSGSLALAEFAESLHVRSSPLLVANRARYAGRQVWQLFSRNDRVQPRRLACVEVTVSPACLGSYLSPNRVALSRVARGLRSCAALVAG
jgi:hypothetical protein